MLTTEKALKFLDENKDSIKKEVGTKLTQRFKTLFDLFNIYARFELSIDVDKANKLLTFYNAKNMDSILWIDDYSWMHKVNIKQYKLNYFLKHKFNKDSIKLYTTLYKKEFDKFNKYLKKKEKNLILFNKKFRK